MEGREDQDYNDIPAKDHANGSIKSGRSKNKEQNQQYQNNNHQNTKLPNVES